MKEGFDVPAFRSKLVPHYEHSHKTRDDTLLQMEDRQDIVIRPLHWVQMIEKRRWHAKESGEVSAEEFATLSRQHFDELREYGINAPVAFIVANDKAGDKSSQEEVFAVVDNVRRTELADKNIAGEAYATMRRNLLRYYTDAFTKQKSFLADLVKDKQYVYGRKKGDSKDSLYLVDVTPYIYWSTHMLRRVVADLHKQLEAEHEYFQNKSFEPIIREAQELIERIDQDLSG